MVIAQSGHEVAHGRGNLDTGQQTLAAQFKHIVGVFLRQLLQMPGQLLAHLVDVIDKAGRQNAVEHGIAHRGRQRIAAIGGAMGAGHHGGSHIALGQAGAQRESAANGLGHSDDVRRDAAPLEGKEATGPTVAALDFIENQQQIVLITQCAQALHVFGRHGGHPALALHGFDQDGAGLRSDQRLDGVEVARRCVLEARHGRAEAFEVARIAARRDGAQRAAMERAGKGDDFVALGFALGPVIVPRGLDSAFERLSARIGEEHRVRKSGIDQALAQPFLLGNGEHIGSVPHLVGGAFERGHQMGITMAQRVDRDTGMEIEIVATLLIEKAHAFAPLKGEFGAGICAKERRHGSYSF